MLCLRLKGIQCPLIRIHYRLSNCRLSVQAPLEANWFCFFFARLYFFNISRHVTPLDIRSSIMWSAVLAMWASLLVLWSLLFFRKGNVQDTYKMSNLHLILLLTHKYIINQSLIYNNLEYRSNPVQSLPETRIRDITLQHQIRSHNDKLATGILQAFSEWSGSFWSIKST